MNRYKAIVEYCGTNYHGMQKQNNLPTVQHALERALLKYCGEPSIKYCGRTDKGVHATGQVIHFDIMQDRAIHSIVQGLNFYLQKESISVIGAERVDMDFHSRMDAKRRFYLYKIFNRSSKLTFMSETHMHCYRPLNVDNMQIAANMLIGRHDFTSFRGRGCNAPSPIKTIDHILISKSNHINGDEVTIEIAAKSFLYNMVRNIVGSLVSIGVGKQNPEWIYETLLAKNRAVAADTAPAYGLYFYKAEY